MEYDTETYPQEPKTFMGKVIGAENPGMVDAGTGRPLRILKVLVLEDATDHVRYDQAVTVSLTP